MTRVAFLCCHLSGTGHLVRTLAIARATLAAGARALVISGGRTLPHVDTGGVVFRQIPPVHVPDFDFRTLRTPEGTVADKAYMARRHEALMQMLTAFRPDALVTETFPLGRRMLAEEFEAAIATTRATKQHAAIIASVRDVPEPPSKPDRLDQAVLRLRRYYDALMVHGDEGFLPLSASWPLPDDLAERVHHTGYVTGDFAPTDVEASDTVLVSVGGGTLGRRLLKMAAEAAAHSNRPWHLLIGGADAAELADALTDEHGRANLTIEPARSDYKYLLAGAACSINLAGYNTFLDLVACDTPAILVPFDEHGEKEQVIRARRLAGVEGFDVMRIDRITPEMLAEAAEAAASGPRRDFLALACNGAKRAAETILLSVAR